MKRGGSTIGLGLCISLAGCPGVVAPGGTGLDGGSTGEPPPITTFNSTIDPTLPGDGTADGEGTTTASAEGTTAVDGTIGDSGTAGPGTTTDPGTTGSSGTTDPSAGATTDPSAGATTDPSTSSTGDPTTGGGCNAVPGNYANCLNMAGAIDNTPCMAPGAATCIYTGALPTPTAGVCSIQDCVDPCDCPAAPPSGNAVISCGDITGVPADLFCYLDCSMGETCPTGMACFGGFLCIWPGPGAAGTPYGDCFNNASSICGFDGVCLNNGAMPTIGVCTTECAVVGDCPPSPGGTAPVSCQDVTADGTPECILDCSGGGSCPAGMNCFGGFLCAWS